MIDISRLYCGLSSQTDSLRYGRRRQHGPVVVFNCTRRCNLRCAHCYLASDNAPGRDEMTTSQCISLLDDLAAADVPVVLFSGGEPLMRDDIAELITHARGLGMRAVLSTNGTLITPETAKRLAEAGALYAGVSLDGMRDTNDAFRGVDGAFELALAGIRNCLAMGLKAGLRLTMTRRNLDDLPAIFDLIERERIPRVCFYHLVYTGRGADIRSDAPDHRQSRRAVDMIIDRTAEMHRRGHKPQVLTVDNHADGPYLYMRLLREDPTGAEQCLRDLQANGGNRSGEGIAAINYDGDVMPDQFWRQHVLGNAIQQPFGRIWNESDGAAELLAQLRRRKELLTGRCARCRWLDMCNGNLRARAEADGDIWGDDPACYLTDNEIFEK